MYKKLIAVWSVFKKGKIVANPEAWKTGQITVAAISAFILALLHLGKIFGVDIPITEEQISMVANVIISINSVFHPIATVVSTEKIGVSSKSETTPMSGGNKSSQGMPGFSEKE